MNKGYFIVFEGPDGSGKTTVAKIVYERLKEEIEEVVLTREPGGSRIAEDIRNIILDTENLEMDARTEALLYAAGRRQHLVELIIPALQDNKLVICDRFVDSSLAYQSYGREIDLNEVIKINDFAVDGYYPDLIIFLDIDVEVGLKRLSKRGGLDRLDLEGLEFHQRVFSGYKKILSEGGKKYQVINASLDIESVVEQSLKKIKDFING